MWNPFHGKKPDKSAVQPRDTTGKFAAPARPDDGKIIEAEGKKYNAIAETMKSMNDTMQTMKAMFEDHSNEDAMQVINDAEESGMMGVIKVVAPVLAPALMPYVGGLIEKYTGVRPNPQFMPTAEGVSSPGEFNPPGAVPMPPAGNTANDQLKMALGLPDAMWTKGNIKKILGQYGLQLDDEDIKKLGQKLSKAK